MKIIIKAAGLFLFGAFTELFRRCFEHAVTARIANGRGISSARLVKMSNLCYSLHVGFLKREQKLKYEMLQKKLCNCSL